ncbi:glycosyltransferase family 2 protein [Lacinutrix undariae]
MNKSVYVIIVTYNGMPWLDTCLKSCANYPVVVVDNASTDTTTSFIETNYPNVILLKQAKNLGFGQANNLGMRYALNEGAAHVFLLNQDAYLVDAVLDELINFQEKNKAYGILSPIHITGDKQRMDKNFSHYMLKEETGQFYSDFVLGNTLASVYELPFVNAAAWLVSRQCLETVGGFDPLFFHYGEDDNYCQRVLYHGFKIGVLPHVYVIHDRENRIQNKTLVFSEQYYTNKEKHYKLEFANINVENMLVLRARKLKKTIFKLQLKTKFKRAAAFKKELDNLLKIKLLVEHSRKRNTTKGRHYL